jgi:hypothetical protein
VAETNVVPPPHFLGMILWVGGDEAKPVDSDLD